MIKHKQHYVWKYYLKAWANNGIIFCKMGEDVFSTNLINVAQERDFYNIKDLNIADIDLLKLFFADDKNPYLKDINERLISLFEFIINFRKNYKDKPLPIEIRKAFENTALNFEEEFQSHYEGIGFPYLEKIKNGDIDFYKELEGNILFNYFIGM